ncbi:MAG: manganese efflux pump MntP [Schwartzia sp. (in: firmicutes)]
MEGSLFFWGNSMLLGTGLAMDAFSVSLANGLNEPRMGACRMGLIAGTFAAFQALMPMTGWGFVHTIVEHFQSFENLLPWIALALLVYIGVSMAKEGRNGIAALGKKGRLAFCMLLAQGGITSIDALSVGFAIAEYGMGKALACSLIIAAVTFLLCLGGLWLGRRFGLRFAGQAQVFGGSVLIFLGAEIVVQHLVG